MPCPVRPRPVEAALYALRLGCLSFGGPAGQIALVSREVVDERAWLDAPTFARALQLAMLLPGPEALQTVIYVGWRLFGVPGAVVSGLAFLGPGAALLVVLAWIYVRFGALAPVAAGLHGLKAVVLALIVTASAGLARKLLHSAWDVAIALLSAGIVLGAHFPVPVALAVGALSSLIGRRGPDSTPAPPWATVDVRHLGRVLGAGLILWAVPLAIAHALEPGGIAERTYLVLSRAALGGFGGAYAVVSWVGPLFAQKYHWLGVADLAAGIGLSETTPGPLLLVLPFYGFVAGWLSVHGAGALTTALGCAALAAWATFLPSFVFVIGLAPEFESLLGRPGIARALHGVGVAVLGVIASFAVSFGRSVLLPAGQIEPITAGIAAVAAVLLWRRWLPLPATLAVGVGLALLLR